MLSIPAKQSIRKDYSKYPFMNLSLEDMTGEEWIDIPGMDGYFKVSNYGRVWALERPVTSITGQFYFIKERIRKQTLVKYYNTYTKDYTEQLTIKLRYEGKVHRYLVNRLVYHLFIVSIDFKKDHLLVVHRDGDNRNNRVNNLVLMNGTELYSHGLAINRRPRAGTIKQSKSKLIWNESNYPRPVVKYALDGKKMAEYESVAHAAKANHTRRGSIRSTITKKSKQLNGFVYRYKGDSYRGEYADFSWEKPVVQYSVDGKKVRFYGSIKEAALQTGIDASTIGKCASGKLRIGSGFVWRYQGDQYRGELKGKIKNRAKPIIQYAPDGKIVNRFDSATKASIETGVDSSTLLDCANKKTKMTHGYVWRFEGDSYKGEYKNYQRGKPVTQFTLEGKKLKIYSTISDGAKYTGLTPDNIQKNVIGQNKTAGGFIWRYATDREIKKLTPYRSPVRHPNTATKKNQVIQYSIDGKKLASYSSVAEAGRSCGIPSFNVYNVLDKPTLTCAGFVWRSQGNRYWGELAKNPSANKAHPITQYSLTGKKLAVFKSMKEAERKTGVSSTTISAVTRGKLKTTGGYIWRLGNGGKKIDIEKYFAFRQIQLAKFSKPLIKYSLNGKRLAEFPSIAEAARAEGVRASLLSSAINNKKKSSLGFIWKLKEV